MENQKELIQLSIKSRKVTYYLVTEQDLNDLKTKGIFGDIFMLLSSIILGGFLSVLIIKLTDISFDIKIIAIINLLYYTFLIFGILFFILAFYFLFQNYSAINQLKSSGKIQTIDTSEDNKYPDNESFGQDNILKAVYFTNKRRIDVTKIVREKYEKRKEIIANNELGGDPEYGIPKKLMIKYIFNGMVLQKEFKEKEKVVIP